MARGPKMIWLIRDKGVTYDDVHLYLREKDAQLDMTEPVMFTSSDYDFCTKEFLPVVGLAKSEVKIRKITPIVLDGYVAEGVE